MSDKKEDIKTLLDELRDLMDGPGPDVEAEIMKNPPTPAVCEHCREEVAKPPNSVSEPKLLNIGEPKNE